MPNFLSGLWNYALPTLTTLYALMQLWKDWTAHKGTWRRGIAMVAIIGVGVASAYGVHRSRVRESEQTATIRTLAAAVDTARRDQQANTKIFTEAFADLSQKLADLQAGMKTADLRREADSLRSQLERTQTALKPAQAKLELGIENSGDRDHPLPWAFINARVREPLSFGLRLVNDGEVSAHSVAWGIRICDDCKFHSEPPGSVHPNGQPEYERTVTYPDVLGRTTMPLVPIEIDVPDRYSRVGVAVMVSCDNCEGQYKWKSLWLQVLRSGPGLAIRPETSKKFPLELTSGPRLEK